MIDVSGKYVFPGFIDVHTHLGLYDEGTGWAGNDANETIETMTPHVRAIDSVYPLDPGFRDAIEHGITTVHIMPGSANVIGGTTAVIKTYGKNVENMIIKQPAGLKSPLVKTRNECIVKGIKSRSRAWALWECFAKRFTTRNIAIGRTIFARSRSFKH